MNIFRMSISAKLSLTLGFILILSFGGLITSHLFNLHKNSMLQGELSAQQQSKIYADSLNLKFVDNLSMLKTLRTHLLESKNQKSQNRELFIGIQKDLLREHPNILGLYTIWEPNAFDGRDAEYGRFIPYVVRNKGLFHPMALI